MRKLNIFLLQIVILFPLITFALFAQAGTYYDALTPSSSSFITDLEGRIRSPYTQVSYDQFDETNVTNFASRDTTGGKRVVTCVYSGLNYVYTPPFTWGTFSREHTWCQSWFPTGGATSSMEGSDQNHLFPTEQNDANGRRSNHPLGIVQNATFTYLDCKLGTNAAGKIVFEPRNIHKGDAARALLYMSVKYNGVGGYDWTFNKLQTFLAANNEGPEDLATLIAWSKQDPPDKWEVDRNNYVQSIQKNRNPFVDHPEYVNYINFNDLSKLSPTYATEPTNYAANLTATNTSGAITAAWTDAASGTQVPSGYLLQAYDRDNYFIPIDGETYSDDANLSDGTAVVNIPYGTTTYSFSSLTANVHYYFTLYSYYGTGTSRNYKINGTFPRANAIYNGTPVVEPTTQRSNIQVSNITSAGMTITWTAGNGTSRIILTHSGSAVNSDPVDLTTYTSNPAFGSGSQIGTGNYVVSNGSGSTANLTGLSPNTTYYFKAYEYNGSGGTENYLTTTPGSASFTTLAVSEPTTQATAVTFSLVNSNDLTVSCTKGNGVYRIILAHSGSAVNSAPVDANTYTANSVFGTGTQIGSGNYVVYAGTGNSVTVTGLTVSTAYYFAVYEYNGSGGTQNYLTTSPATGNSTTISITEPTTQASGVTFSSVGSTNLTLSCTAGNGTNRIIVAHSGSAVDLTPADGITYSGSAAFGTGTQIGTGNYVVYSGTGTAVTVTGLTASTTYYFAVYEFNGSGGAENYLSTSTATGSQATTAATTLNHIIISEVYGGGGNSGAYYKYDFIILYNPTSTSQTISSYSIQYASSGGTSWSKTNLTGSIASNKYYIIQEAGGTSGANLPITPDLTSTAINLSGTTGKVALVSNQTTLSGSYTTGTGATIIDFVGFGTANAYEGSGAAPAPSNTTSVMRKNEGKQDTDNNNSDFFVTTAFSASYNMLPVELSSFNSYQNGRSVLLNWETKTEKNSDRFEILRSPSETESWETIGTVKASVLSNSPKQYSYTEKNLQSGKYIYRLKMIDNDGTFDYSKTIEADISLPKNFELNQNYPNPFNPSTVISYSLPFDCNVRLTVYDAVGRMVKEIANENQKGGYHNYNFNAGNLSSGVYLYNIAAVGNNGEGVFHSVKKFALIK